MGQTITALRPLPDRVLGALGWNQPLIGVEHQILPVFDRPPPDHAAIRARALAEQERMVGLHRTAVARAAFFRFAFWAAVWTLVLSVLFTFLLIAGVASAGSQQAAIESQGVAAPAAMTSPSLFVTLLIAMFLPWFALVALNARRKLAGRGLGAGGFFAAGVGLWFLALFLSFFIFGMGFTLIPAAVALWVLLTRPALLEATGHLGVTNLVKAHAPLFALYFEARRRAREARSEIGQTEQRMAEAVQRADEEYQRDLHDFQARTQGLSPFRVVTPPERQDILVIGGSPVERGDLLHHAGAAAIVPGTRVWLLDLEGRGASNRLVSEAEYHRRRHSVLGADDEPSLVATLDRLSHHRGRRHQLTEALAAALSDDAEGRVTRQARNTADTLNRLGAILLSTPEGVSVATLLAAIEVLLGSGTDDPRGPSSGGDDFGFAVLPEPERGSGLPAETVARIRAEFTRQDREHFHPAWTDLRIKLSSLFSGEEPAGAVWTPDGDLSCAVVPPRLSDADRELRSAVLLAHHIELLRWGTVPPPGALVVVGADRIRPELLRHLSEVASESSTRLVLMFGEYTDNARELARGRRAVMVFGGHGAEAAEELSDLFGKDWIDRLQSYQDSWSDSVSKSRAETSGRSWSKSDTWNHSDESGRGGGSSHGENGSGWNSSWSSGSSDSYGGSTGQGESESITDTTGRSRDTGHTQSRQIDYERRVTGRYISNLPPFTAVLKVGETVAYIDVHAELVLPPQLTGDPLPPLPPYPAAQFQAPQSQFQQAQFQAPPVPSQVQSQPVRAQFQQAQSRQAHSQQTQFQPQAPTAPQPMNGAPTLPQQRGPGQYGYPGVPGPGTRPDDGSPPR